MQALLALIGGLTLIVGTVLYNVLSWGYVCYKFWSWYVTPVFTDLPIVEFWQAVGLMFFISLFKNHSSISIKSEFQDKSSSITSFIINPWILLVIGYLFL
jgi:hypothetical protein